MSYLVLEHSKEGQGKGDDEEEEDDEELGEGVEDVGEHDDVDAEARKLLDEEEQIQPGQEDGNGSQGPLPLLHHRGHRSRPCQMLRPVQCQGHAETTLGLTDKRSY